MTVVKTGNGKEKTQNRFDEVKPRRKQHTLQMFDEVKHRET